jgi:hypothetical protein
MSDLKLDPVTHDLDLSTGDLQIVTGLDAIVQRLRIRYQFFLGEWFLDERQGIPFYQKILIKNPNFADVNSILREVATTTPGVAEVNRVDFDFDSATREFTVDLWARSDDDEPIEVKLPFIVGGRAAA